LWQHKLPCRLRAGTASSKAVTHLEKGYHAMRSTAIAATKAFDHGETNFTRMKRRTKTTDDYKQTESSHGEV
jgi:hypothetical protein